MHDAVRVEPDPWPARHRRGLLGPSGGADLGEERARARPDDPRHHVERRHDDRDHAGSGGDPQAPRPPRPGQGGQSQEPDPHQAAERHRCPLRQAREREQDSAAHRRQPGPGVPSQQHHGHGNPQQRRHGEVVVVANRLGLERGQQQDPGGARARGHRVEPARPQPTRHTGDGERQQDHPDEPRQHRRIQRVAEGGDEEPRHHVGQRGVLPVDRPGNRQQGRAPGGGVLQHPQYVEPHRVRTERRAAPRAVRGQRALDPPRHADEREHRRPERREPAQEPPEALRSGGRRGDGRSLRRNKTRPPGVLIDGNRL